MEILDIVDEYGHPTGKTIERNKAHLEGIRHRTSHVWIYRIYQGRPEILLQKRCADKDSFPNCYDISSAGHIPAGCDYETSALRELQEELGVTASKDQLIFCGYQSVDWDDNFRGVPYHDRQVSKIFLLRLDNYKESDFTVQESEVAEVRWMDWKACICAIRANSIRHCIDLTELAKLAAGDPILALPE